MLDDRYMPRYRFKSVCDITTEDLKAMGVDGLLLDIDNTLIYDETLRPLPGVKEWLEHIHSAGIKTAIVSNAIPLRVIPVAKKLNIRYYIYSAKKPRPDGLFRAAQKLGLPIERLAMVGDQLKTDILAANTAGAVAVFTDRARDEKIFKFYFKKARDGEKELLQEFERKKTEK